MHLSPRDIDKLMLHQAGFLAQKRLWRGLRLNYPEAVALIASQLLEFIRDGKSVPELMDLGKTFLGHNDVMPGVPALIVDVQVEGTFPDGTKLVTVHDPVCRDDGDAKLALYGSGLDPRERMLPAPSPETSPHPPGAFSVAKHPVILNAGRSTIMLEVINMGDRPVQVGSHYPFFETNASLRFDRAAATGFRLDIPSGTAVRFEPGERKSVRLVALGGHRTVYGGNGLINGPVDGPNAGSAMTRATRHGFLTTTSDPETQS